MRENGELTPVVLVVGGFDGSGGAGISADLRMVERVGGYGVGVLTAVTVQDHCRCAASTALEPRLIEEQMNCLLSRYTVAAVKIGMLACAGAVTAVARSLPGRFAPPLVIDPVMRSSSGAVLLDESGQETLIRELIPRASLITPNLPEARVLGGESREDLPAEALAEALVKRYGVPVLLKGGHAEGPRVRDILVDGEGRVSRHDGQRVEGVNGHGTGCRLASAITGFLALGRTLHGAVSAAKEVQNDLFENPVYLSRFGAVLA